MSKPSIQRRSLMVAASVLVLAGLAACNQPLSYEKASQMEPYKSIASSEDRRWLYNFHQSPQGALDWMENEMRLLDDSVQNIWNTSEATVEFEYEGGKKYTRKRDDVVALVRSKGGTAAARELAAAAHKEVGGSARPPEKPYVLLGPSDAMRRAQKLMYPQLYQVAAIAQTQLIVQKAGELNAAGKLPAALDALSTAIEMRIEMLGEDHPATKGAKEIYQAYAKKPYVKPAEAAEDDDEK
jgi:hypothetical protein